MSMTLAQVRGALEAHARADREVLRNALHIARAAQAKADDYRRVMRSLDDGQ